MAALYKIKSSLVIYILLIMGLSISQKSVAQRFSHASGGGGGFNRSAPTFNHSAAPTMTRSVSVPSPVTRTINGGSLNNGNHNFNRNNTVVNVTAHTAVTPRTAPVNARTNTSVHENFNVYHSPNQSFHPYAYHPYHPYYWGPSWHPIGFFAATLAADAFYFSIANQPYYYDDGVYYEPTTGGYTAIPPPVGAIVNTIPDGYETVQVGDDYFYYYAGTFYIGTDQGGYQVVTAPLGAVVTDIPDGAAEQDINGQSYLIYNNTYYQPVSQNGQDAYEVVQAN
jgi:hypothetical protein